MQYTKSLMFWIWIALFLVAPLVHAETIERMEGVLERYESLDAFLVSEAGMKDFFEAAQARYGADRFHRASFDKIVGQLRILNADVDGFGARAWEKSTDGSLGRPFTIRTDLRISGKKLNREKWDKIFNDWMAPSTMTDEAARQLFEAKAAELAKHTDGKAKGTFFQSLNSDVEFQRAINHAVQTNLGAGKIGARLRSGDADLVLHTVGELKQNPALALAGFGEAALQFKSQAKTAVGFLEKHTADAELFPPIVEHTKEGKAVPIGGADAGEIEAIPVPRKIYAFFKHIILNECVGGGLEHLDSTTPERWASNILEESQVHELQRKDNKKYAGFSQATPFQQRSHTDRVFADVEFGSTLMKKGALVKDESSPTGYRRTTFLNQWLTEAKRHSAPAHWLGFTVPEWQAGDNTGVLTWMRQQPTYRLGPALDQAEYLQHRDPIAALIIEKSPKEGFAGEHGGNMILSSFEAKSERLVQLVPRDEGPSVMESIPRLRDLLKSLTVAERMRVVESLASRVLSQEAVDFLAEILQTDRNNSVRAAAAYALMNLAEAGDPKEGSFDMKKRYGFSESKFQLGMTLLPADAATKPLNFSRAREALTHALDYEEPTVRAFAARGLYQLGDRKPEHLADFYRLLGNPDPKSMPLLMEAVFGVPGFHPRDAEHLDFVLDSFERIRGASHPELHQTALQILREPIDPKVGVHKRYYALQLLAASPRPTFETKQLLLKEFKELLPQASRPSILFEEFYPDDPILRDDPEMRRTGQLMQLQQRDPLMLYFLSLLHASLMNDVIPVGDAWVVSLVKLAHARETFRPGEVDAMLDNVMKHHPQAFLAVKWLAGQLLTEKPGEGRIPDVSGRQFLSNQVQRLRDTHALCRMIETLLGSE